MATMYDSINLAAIPATATDILIYTDGANTETAAEVKTRWPNATYHTISVMGQVLAQWIDVEPGAVWPNQNAANLFHVWGTQGCKGYYSSLNNMQALKEAHQTANPGMPAEYFDANYTGVEQVDPGYVATQYADPGPYDISDTTPEFEGTDPPIGDEEDMKQYALNNALFLSNGLMYRWLTSNTDVGDQEPGLETGQSIPNAIPMGYPMTAHDAALAGDTRTPLYP